MKMFLQEKTFIIAEAGVNHNGDPKIAHKLIDLAAETGVDAIKFQTFNASKVCTKLAPKADYQIANTVFKSQIEMLKALELDRADFTSLSDHAKQRGLIFMSTAFDNESLDFLVDELDMKIIKVPSGEIDNYEFLDHVSKKKLPTIISTGASTVEEIDAAVCLTTQAFKMPDREKIFDKLVGEKVVIDSNVAILHCISEYPAPLSEANIRCIRTLAKRYDCAIGYSDHCQGIAASIAAVSNGASVLEKHFTIDRSMSGPDHSASIEGSELKKMVKFVREIECVLGSQDKKVFESEIQNREIIRRSIVALTDIKKGDIFSRSNLTCKRPANGIPASCFFDLIGRTATKGYAVDDRIEEDLS